MFNKKNLCYFLVFLLLVNCTSLRIGKEERIELVDEREKESSKIEEVSIDFSYKVMGYPVAGKVMIEDFFIHPDGFIFFFSSFPKIGIIKTDLNLKVVKNQFFKLTDLEDFFGYIKDDDKKNSFVRKRIFYKFAFSNIDKNKMVLSAGGYIFLSKDKGETWKTSRLFDYKNSVVRDIIITEEEKILIFTNKGLFISTDWGNKWATKKFPDPKLECISAVIKNKRLYVSFRNILEKDSFLLNKTSELIFDNKKSDTKSFLFFTDDFGNSWIKCEINIPVVLWEKDGEIFASTIYPINIYKSKFTDSFKNSSFYGETNISNTNSSHIREYFSKLIENYPDDNEILSLTNNAVLKLTEDKWQIKKEDRIDALIAGILKLQDLDYIQWDKNIYSKKIEKDFLYEYNFFRFFKRWTATQVNGFSVYSANDSSVYRARGSKEFFEVFINECLNEQIKLDRINPFLKKVTDIEFISSKALHKTKNLLVLEEFKNGKWENIVSDSLLEELFSKLIVKCNEEYWYKNIEQKKQFRLQVNLGFDKDNGFMVYPIKIKIVGDYIYILFNYFSVTNSYKELYRIKINR